MLNGFVWNSSRRYRPGLRIVWRNQLCHRLGRLQDRPQGLRRNINFHFLRLCYGVYSPDAFIKEAVSPGSFPREVTECLSSLLQNTFSFSLTGRSVRIVSAMDGAGEWFVVRSAWRRESGCWGCCRLGVCVLLVAGELNMTGYTKMNDVIESTRYWIVFLLRCRTSKFKSRDLTATH